MAKYLFLIILSVTHANDINVEAKVINNYVRPGDKVHYDITIKYKDSEITIEEPTVSNMEGLTLEQEHTSSGSHTSIINGAFNSQKTKTFSYTFGTNKEGKFTIPSYEVLADNKPFFTDEIEINVSNSAPQKSNRFFNQPFFQDFFDNENKLFNLFRDNEIEEDEIFIRAQTDKTNVYIGERVQASWYLYTTQNVHNISHLKHPTLEGFWKEDIEIPTKLSFQQEVINNKRYNKALLFRYDLFPLKTGELYIDEYRARYTMFFQKKYVRESEKIKINVSKLPQEGKPDGFNNTVGEYNIHLKRMPSQVETNTPFNYTIVIDGYGNINKLTLPDINFQPLKVYDALENAHYETRAPDQGRGFKEFEHLLIAQKKGKYILPEIQFSFFSPKQKKYITQSIPSVELIATGEDFVKTYEDETDRPNELPYFETSIGNNWFDNKYVTILLAMILFVFVLTKSLIAPKKPISTTILDKIKKLANTKEPDRLSVLALDIISHLLREITGSNNPINSELVQLIPISKKHLKPKFKELIFYFEKLAFFTNPNVELKELNKNIKLLIALSKLI